MNNFYKQVDDLIAERKSFVVMTLINVIGSAPQEVGAKALVSTGGLIYGTVGGGKIEAHAIKFAMNFLSDDSKKIELMKWNLQTDIGMTCGGVVEILFERNNFDLQFKIAVFGAGHVAIETVSLLSKLNAYVINIETRKEWQNKISDKANIKKIICEEMASVIDQLDDDYFIVSLTMGHSYDRPILSKALKRNFKFVGVIGSKQKATVLKNELREDGVTEAQLNKLHCPIGLPFGNNEPIEIAISIVGQLIQERDK